MDLPLQTCMNGHGLPAMGFQQSVAGRVNAVLLVFFGSLFKCGLFSEIQHRQQQAHISQSFYSVTKLQCMLCLAFTKQVLLL